FLLDGRDRAAVEADDGARRDLDVDDLVLDLSHRAVDAAGSQHILARLQRVLHPSLLDLLALLRPHEEQPHGGEEHDDDDQVAHVASGARRASASALYDRSSPRSIASRAPATRSSRERRLCRLSRRNPRISCWLSRCRTYARVNRAHAGHEHPSSSGRWSRAKRAALMLSWPSQVSALPVRALRVGRTQSNMSIPRSIT